MYFNNPFILGRLLSVVPIDPQHGIDESNETRGDRSKTRKSIEHLSRRRTRFLTENFLKFKKGAAIVATQLDMPIVPVAIDGIYKVSGATIMDHQTRESKGSLR